MIENKQAAALRAGGFHVFPLLHGKKLPSVAGWNDPAAHWPVGPEHNIGVFTGAFGDDEALLVVDIDAKEGKAGFDTILNLELEGREFPKTYEVDTPSGGRHLYYRTPAAVKSGVEVLGPGVDIRSAGGFVVGPGSRLDGFADGYRVRVDDATGSEREIALAPDWLVTACGQPRERQPREEIKPLTGYAAEVAYAKAQRYLQDEAPEAIEGAGGDRTTYEVACRVRDFGVTEAECVALMLDDWFGGCAWLPEDLEKKVANAYRYATGDFAGANPAAVFEPVAQTATPPGASASGKAAMRYRLDSVAELVKRPPPKWLIRGVLPEQGLAVVFGPPGCGKTFLTLDLAAAVARGTPWGDRRTRKGRAVYVGLEGHVATRVAAYLSDKEINASEMANLSIVERQPLNLREGKDGAYLVQAIKDASPDPCSLVVVDTLNRAMQGGDENDSQDMGSLIAMASAMAERLQCLVVLVHHSGKAEGSGARGHSSLRGAADAELSVSRTDDGAHFFEISKAKDGADGDKFAFDLATIDLGAARDTDPEAEADERITSCSIRNITKLDHNPRTEKVKLGDHAANIVEAIRSVQTVYEGDVERAFEDASVLTEQVKDAFRTLCADDPAWRKRFYDGWKELVRKKVIRIPVENRVELIEPKQRE